jgi:ribosomal protein S6
LNAEFKNSDFVNEFKVFLNLHSEVLKYIIIKLDGKPEAPKEDAPGEVEDKKEEEK